MEKRPQDTTRAGQDLKFHPWGQIQDQANPSRCIDIEGGVEHTRNCFSASRAPLASAGGGRSIGSRH